MEFPKEFRPGCNCDLTEREAAGERTAAGAAVGAAVLARRALFAFSLIALLVAFAVAARASYAAPDFGDRTDFPAGIEPRSVASADFDRDGSPDLAVASTGSNNIPLLLGDGIGGFRSGTPFSPIYALPPDWAMGNASLTSDDFNRDGKPDLAVAYSAGSTSPPFLARTRSWPC